MGDGAAPLVRRGRGRPRKDPTSLAAETDLPVSFYLPLAQSAWLKQGGKGVTVARIIAEATGVPPPPAIDGASARDAIRLPPAIVARLDVLVEAAVEAGDREASRSSVLRALIGAAQHSRRRPRQR